MNDIRRTILWVIFGFSMVLLWDQWQIHNGKQATFFPNPAQKAAAQAANAASAPVASAASASAGTAPVVGEAAAPAAVSERVVVETDLLKLTFDTAGGSLVRSEFKQHADMADKSHDFVLLDTSNSSYYAAQSGVVAGKTQGTFPNHTTVMAVSGDRQLKEGQDSLVVTFTSPDVNGVKLTKTYTLKRGSYDIAVSHAVTNTSAVAIEPQVYLQLVRDGNKPAGTSSFYSTFTGASMYTDEKKYQKVEFSEIKKTAPPMSTKPTMVLSPWCSTTLPAPGFCLPV